MLMFEGTNQNENDLNDVNAMFSSLKNMFCDLETEHLRMNALENDNSYIRPILYTLGVGEKTRFVNGEAVLTEVNLTGQHIPMKSVLKSFFELPGVFQATLDNVTSLKNSDKFTNIVQSPLWQNIEINHFEGKIAFPLFLYFDDVEPDNQTGSHSGDHSLGGVYYQVPCIPQHLVSSLDNIFVAGIFLSADRHRNHGEAFRPILNELKDLESNGIVINTETGEHHLYFGLTLFLGDNKGFHQITGLIEGFNANYFCRFCKEHRQVTRTQTRENVNLLRNQQNYNDDVLINDQSITGIKRPCIWNILDSYHVIDNVMCDIFHDLLEGVCHYDLTCILNELIYVNNFFTLDTLNERIQGFNYGPDSGNKCTLITQEHIRREKLKMSGSEMLFFVRNFGLIIGDLVPRNNECWRLYEVLAEILDFLFAPFVVRGATAYLATLIAEHHELYCNVFGKTLKPKHHFMVHYPRILNLIGPLIHVWSMRFEAKHRPVIKQVAKSMTCRKNLPLSCAIRYLLGLCKRLLSKQGFPNEVLCEAREERVQNTDNYENFHDILPNYHETLKVVREIFVRGTRYVEGMSLAVNYEADLPLFGKVHRIIKPDGNEDVRFILSPYATVGFNSHLHCYEVTPTNEWFIVASKDLLSFYPLFPRTGSDGCTYLTFRHAL